MDSQHRASRKGIKSRLLNALKTGAGSMVYMSAVMTAAPATAAGPPATAPIVERAEAARTALTTGNPADRAAQPQLELAWWRNWGNGGWHPGWHNWPNWHNWHNWHNWGNF